MIRILAFIFVPIFYLGTPEPFSGQGVEAPKGLSLVDQTFSHRVPSKFYEYSISFPEVVKYHPNTAHSINNHIQTITSKALDEFQRRVAGLAESKKVSREIGINVMKLGYTVNFNDDGVLSIVFDKYVNVADAPEAYQIHLAFNYHYHNDQPLRLQDIFLHKDAARKYINTKIKSQYPDAKYTNKHLANFVIVPAGIKFYFNNGLDGVRQAPATFSVTWSELNQFLNEDYKGDF